MAEGADGEEEIQFLRTVSDAPYLFSISCQLLVNLFINNEWQWLCLSMMWLLYNRQLDKRSVCLVAFFTQHRQTGTGGWFCQHCFLFISHRLLDIQLFCHREENVWCQLTVNTQTYRSHRPIPTGFMAMFMFCYLIGYRATRTDSCLPCDTEARNINCYFFPLHFHFIFAQYPSRLNTSLVL